MDEQSRKIQHRADSISDAIDTEATTLAAKMALETGLNKRVFWLHSVADELVRAAEGNVICKDKCPHCCYQPVAITQLEAQYIALRSGKGMSMPAAFVLGLQPRYVGIPCPMLDKGSCSIYEFRPLQCRLHYSLEDTPEPCKFKPGVPTQPNIVDTSSVQLLAATALEEQMYLTADIRDFFKSAA